MITNYKNKMQLPLNQKYSELSDFKQTLLRAKYDHYQVKTAQKGEKPLSLRDWLEKEGY